MSVARAPIAAGVVLVLLFGLGFGLARALGSSPPKAALVTLPAATPAAQVSVRVPPLAGRAVALIRSATTTHRSSTPVSTVTQSPSPSQPLTGASAGTAGSTPAGSGNAGPTATSFSSGGD
jgi:hypothetical protein